MPDHINEREPQQVTTIEAFGTDHARRCLETERAFVAACIFDPAEALKFSDRLGGEHFTDPSFWHLYSCIIVSERRGTDLSVADLGKLAVMADLDLTEFDLWNLLDEQWGTTGAMVPMLADTLIRLAADEDRFRSSLQDIHEIAGDDADRIIEDQLPKRPTGLTMPSRVRRAWRRKNHARVTV